MQTVLVVKDEPAIAETVACALRGEGFGVEHCLVGREAVDRIRRGGADLVVLDVGLPDMDGFEVCRQLRAFSAIPAIFLAARNEEVDRVAGLELGGDDYMAKPLSPRSPGDASVGCEWSPAPRQALQRLLGRRPPAPDFSPMAVP